MLNAEAFLDPCNTRENFLSDDECIGFNIDFLQTDVTGLAIRGFVSLPKMFDQCPMTTDRPFATTHHLIELPHRL